jgi:hypothetical protein
MIAFGEMNGGGNQSTWRKHTPVPLCPPQIPHGLTWARTRAPTVGSQQLTTWATARSIQCWLFMIIIIANKIVILFTFFSQSRCNAARRQAYCCLYVVYQHLLQSLSLIWELCWVQITQIVMHQEHSRFYVVTLVCLARLGKWNVHVGGCLFLLRWCLRVSAFMEGKTFYGHMSFIVAEMKFIKWRQEQINPLYCGEQS